MRGQYSQRRLRLRLDADAPELHSLPWELLREPGEGVSLDLTAADSTPFSRYLAGQWAYQLADTGTQREDKLRLVFLAGCQSATRGPADACRGLAPRLVQAGGPAVLARQDLVPIDTAREFSQAFHQPLLAHGLVDLAGNEARAALLAAKLPGVAIPVLYEKVSSGVWSS